MTPSEYQMFRVILRRLWGLSGREVALLAVKAQVDSSTLYNWKAGRVISPRLDTLSRVARELGYNITLEVR